MTGFASGNLAVAICDRCGKKYRYTQLRAESQTDLRVCHQCMDHPIPYRRLKSTPDKIALRHPRPDIPISDI